MDQSEATDEATSPIDVVVGLLMTEANNDLAEALVLAAATIVGLSDAASYGFMRSTPYKEVRAAKGPPPPAIE